jgi:hypothetical protein
MVGRLRAYMAIVAAIGFVALCPLAASVDLDRMRGSLPAGAMLALVMTASGLLYDLAHHKPFHLVVVMAQIGVLVLA